MPVCEELMDASRIEAFMTLAGQKTRLKLETGDPKTRALGAQLLLSEVLEYVIHGLGVTPVVNGTPITAPDSLTYEAKDEPDPTEMVDGLADVAICGDAKIVLQQLLGFPGPSPAGALAPRDAIPPFHAKDSPGERKMQYASDHYA